MLAPKAIIGEHVMPVWTISTDTSAICFVPVFATMTLLACWILVTVKMQDNLAVETKSDHGARAKNTSILNSASFAFQLFGLIRLTDCILLIVTNVSETSDVGLLTATAVLETLGGTFLLKVFVGYALFNETQRAFERHDSTFRQGQKQTGINAIVLLCVVLFIVGSTNSTESWSRTMLKVSSVLLLVTTVLCGLAFLYMITQGTADLRYFPAIVLLLVRVCYNTASVFDHSISLLFGNAHWAWLAFALLLPESLFCAIIGYIQYTVIGKQRSPKGSVKSQMDVDLEDIFPVPAR